MDLCNCYTPTLCIRFLYCNHYRAPAGSFEAGPDLSLGGGNFPELSKEFPALVWPLDFCGRAVEELTSDIIIISIIIIIITTTIIG